MAKAASAAPDRTFDVLRDTIDFRDTLYVPTLVRIAGASDLAAYRAYGIPVLDQGREGACTGFALATVANYLLRARGNDPSASEVSAWMLYTMAKRYDEWPGESYSGSSARGAMKGWHKHGLCALRLWRDGQDSTFTEERAADAIQRPLGAYFRVNHKDLVAMHAAITEVGVLFATARVHPGWQAVREGDDSIAYRQGDIGGHAFAIVGYDRDGFWIQNSWGPDWGSGGLARLSYTDWLINGSDVWVAALGAPVRFEQPVANAPMMSGAPRSYESRTYADLRPHIVMAGNDGVLDPNGAYGLTPDGLRNIVVERLPRRVAAWRTKRVVLYAHGGLVKAESAIQTVANNLETLMREEVYPISFIWHSDALTTLSNILREGLLGRRSEGVLEAATDFMFDRVDDTLEPLARLLGGKALWDEMKENADGATTNRAGAARLTADHLADLHARGAIDEIHLVGHSAGAVFHARLAAYLAGKQVPIRSLSLWAPACTVKVFNRVYKPLIARGAIEAFDLYTLDDATEQADDCAGIYHKSLLYLVSAALEEVPRISGGTALLGLQRDAEGAIPRGFWQAPKTRWLVAPGAASRATHHGDFDDDGTTLLTTLARITGRGTSAAAIQVAETTRNASPVRIRRARRRLGAALVPLPVPPTR